MERLAVVMVSVSVMACTPVPVCVPGRVETCPCSPGGDGVQTCLEDGRFGECVCRADDAGMEPDGGGVDAAPPMDVLTDVALLDVPPTVTDAPPDTGPDAGPPHGHIVLFGHPSLGEEFQARAILNAIFLSERPRTEVRILEYTEFEDGWRMYTHDDIEPAAVSRGRTVTFTSLTSYLDLDARLDATDVLLVYPQGATTAQMQTIADTWHDSLLAFARGGGVVVVLTNPSRRGPGGAQIVGDEYRLVRADDMFLIPVGPLMDSGFPLPPTEVATPTDPIADGVISYVTLQGINCFPMSFGGTNVIRTAASATTLPPLCPVVRHLTF